jgi:negative regulator of flagellin synthesis FlgM
MKIESGIKQVAPLPVENRPAQPQAGKQTANERTDVNLSARATELKQLEAELAAIPVIDPARVDAIKAAIASGQYAVDAGKIADGLINSVKEMLHVAK